MGKYAMHCPDIKDIDSADLKMFLVPMENR